MTFMYQLQFLIIVSLVSITKAQLYIEKVNEPPCIFPETSGLRDTLNLPTLLRNLRNAEALYVPMGSKHMYRAYANTLLGRAPANQTELDSMNLRIKYTLATNTLRTTGYNSTLIQFCVPFSLQYRALCLGLYGSPGTNLESSRRTVDSLVYVDPESTTFLITRCVNRRGNDWKLISTTPTIDPVTEKIIVQKIIELGYDLANVEYFKY